MTTLEQETKIWYVHDTYLHKVDRWWSEKVRRTIALKYNSEAKHVEVGVAICSPNDQFCKRTGRVKASGRLLGKSKSHYYVVYPSYPGGYQELIEKLGGGSEELEAIFKKIVEVN